LIRGHGRLREGPVNAVEVAKRAARSARAFLGGPGIVIAASWFVASYAALVWTWGRDPLTFPSPDEMLNRMAAGVIGEHVRPFLALPFDDPEDLAHPRFWISFGQRAVPAYAPVALYVYAALLKLPLVGFWLVPAVPASATAAFALGTARLLPRGRRWLAALAPVLGFPALYWLLRPWVNISLLLVCLCWAFFCWATWQTCEPGKSRTRWLFAAIGFVGFGAAIRPDYAAYLLAGVLLFALAESREEAWRIVAFVLVAGAAAVILNLALNFVITGHPLKAAYQVYMDRAADDSAGEATLLPGIVNSLLTPMGLHTPAEIHKLVVKYWLEMRPLGLLVVGQLALVPLFYWMPWKKRLVYLAAIVVVLCLAVTRLSDEVWGSKVSAGYVHHSVPRYLTPVYLLAALPPLLFLGRVRLGVTQIFGSALALLLAVRSGYEICVHQPDSLKYLHKLAATDKRTLDVLKDKLPARALVYTQSQDKVLWSRWKVGTVSEPERTAASMNRAIDAGLPVYVMQPRFGSGQLRGLERALRAKRISLTPLDSRRGLYRLHRASEA
jgi:hypothetical protein